MAERNVDVHFEELRKIDPGRKAGIFLWEVGSIERGKRRRESMFLPDGGRSESPDSNNVFRAFATKQSVCIAE